MAFNLPVPSNAGPIQQPVEIDDMLVNIAAIDAQIEHYEALKKHRVAAIQREIDKLEEYKQQFRDAIKQFMTDHGEKTLNYPGVGKVTRKAGARKWNIKDEENLIEFLKAKLEPSAFEVVVVQEPKIVKKELNKVLDKLAAANQLVTDAVELDAGQESLTVTFEKGDDALLTNVKAKQAEIIDATQPTPQADTKKVDYDSLEV